MSASTAAPVAPAASTPVAPVAPIAPATEPKVTRTLTSTPAVVKAAKDAFGGKSPKAAVKGKRNSGEWQKGKSLPGASAVAKAVTSKGTKLAACQIRALVALSTGTEHHNARVIGRLAAKGLCTKEGKLTVAGQTIVKAASSTVATLKAEAAKASK